MVFFRRRKKITQVSAFPLVTVDFTLRIVRTNKAFREIVSPSNILSVGDALTSILDKDGDKARLKNALVSQSSVDLDFVTVADSSGNFPIVRRLIVHIARHDDKNHVTLTLTPVEHKQSNFDVDASELIDFFDSAPIALHWLSGEGKVIWANKRELEVLGYSRDEYIGHDIMKFCPDSEETVLEIFKQLGTGNTIRDVPVRFRTKEGNIKDLLIDSNVNFKSDGTFNHTRCFIRDDTVRKVTEARSEATMQSLLKVTQEKEKFVSRLLHEMRTPVHIIQMSSEQRDSSRVVRSQSAFLGRTLHNVSTAIRFDEGNVVTYRPESVHLDALMADVIRKVGRESLDANISYFGIEGMHYMFDSFMITSALEEIVLNSILRSNGKKVVMRVTDSGKSTLVFSVEDTGEYVDDEHTHDIFQNYWRCAVPLSDCSSMTDTLSDLSSSSSSMGVGMNVAFNYVECMGSTLEMKSSLERTCFEFAIVAEGTPCHNSCQHVDMSSYSWTSVELSEVSSMHVVDPLKNIGLKDRKRHLGLEESRARHVLIVDDNTICQKVCKRLVEKMGHVCEVASNGAIAMNMVADVSFDIVFMDLRMPVMDGIDSARAIRHDLHSDVPIVAFSAESNKDVIAATKDVGMNDFLEKPATSPILEEMINKYCY